MQDAFLKIFSNVGKFKGKGSFEGWMKRVLVNEALMSIRSKSAVQVDSIDDYDLEDYDSELEEDDFVRFSNEQLYNALESLPDNYRSVFNLAVIEDYSHKEISQMLDISEANSRAILLKARRKLKGFLTKRGVRVESM